jgi:hypothetical protein
MKSFGLLFGLFLVALLFSSSSHKSVVKSQMKKKVTEIESKEQNSSKLNDHPGRKISSK